MRLNEDRVFCMFTLLQQVLLASSCLSTRESMTSTRQIFMKFYILDFYVNLSRNPNIWLQLDNNISHCIWRPNCAGDVNLPYYWCAKKTIFLLLTMTCGSAVYRKCIVAFPQQELLREHSMYVFQYVCTILCCWISESYVLCRLIGHVFRLSEGLSHTN
jgi:hypothetical protein